MCKSYKPVGFLETEGWDDACRRVKTGLKRIGHDIKIVGYGSGDEVRMAAANKRAAGLGR